MDGTCDLSNRSHRVVPLFFFIIIIIYIIFSLCNFVIYNLVRLCVKNVESKWHYPAE